MLTSVLIAAYKAAPYIATALESVRAQSHTDWELIVVEDGSNDGTEALVAAFAATVKQAVRYHNLGTNQGVAAARNKLMELARGEYFAFLDSDDQWHPRHLEDLGQCLAQGHCLAFTGIELWDLKNNRPLGTHLPPHSSLERPRQALFEESLIMTSSCVALPATGYRRIGNFDTSLRIGEDRDYWFRLLQAGGSLGCTGQMSCRYAKHEGSSMGSTLRWLEDQIKFYDKHQNAADIPAGLRRKKLSQSLEARGKVLLRSQPRLAATCLGKAWRLSPLRLPALARYLVASVLGLRRPPTSCAP